MSRACAAKLVTKSSVGGEPAMAARTVPPWAGHLSMAAPHAPDAVNIVSATLAVISLRSIAPPLLSVTQEPPDAGGHDLLLADLEAAPEAVPGDPIQGLLHELLRRHPRGRRHIHVHLLEQGGCDELSATEEKAAGLRPPECLASAHGHEVGAFRDEAREI